VAADDSTPGSSPSPDRRPPDESQQFGIAFELPIVFVGAVVIGGGLGWFLDRWLHTQPWLLIVFGAFGFYAGLREILRRLQPRGSGGKPGKTS
jgi:F0F1-type ATP synthase assembly protein I